MKDKVAVINELEPLLRQLGFVSKTKALCMAELVAESEPPFEPLKEGNVLRVVLQTPALLADPRFQDGETAESRSGAISAEQMTALYRAAWRQLSGGGLELSHHFSRQRLAGGNYLARRYQRGKAYNPWLLTTEGSVFVLTVKNSSIAQGKLKQWLRRGLELPDWAVRQHGSTWKTNPYLPQNGFGEIAFHKSHPSFPEPSLGETLHVEHL